MTKGVRVCIYLLDEAARSLEALKRKTGHGASRVIADLLTEAGRSDISGAQSACSSVQAPGASEGPESGSSEEELGELL